MLRFLMRFEFKRQVFLPEGYLAGVYEEMRAAGVVCIADEVQCGFGRVGDVFWGFELSEVVPDIVVMGKPIGVFVQTRLVRAAPDGRTGAWGSELRVRRSSNPPLPSPHSTTPPPSVRQAMGSRCLRSR